jgi:molecular chaperone GrpE
MDNENKKATEETLETETEAVETPETPDTPEQESAEAAPEANPLEEKLKEKEKEYLYLRAEYDNFRRRSVKEKTEAYSKAKADAAEKFLPVYDNLERALQHGSEDEAFLKGVEMTMNQLKQVLESLDIHPIEAVGQPFDPNLHNAVMHVEDESFGENIVAEELQKGYMFKDTVVRHSMVKVAN